MIAPNMPERAAVLPEITAGDMQAAAHLNGYGGWQAWEIVPHHDEEWMRLCAHDFARHREQSEAPLRKRIAELEGELREAYEQFDEPNPDDGPDALDLYVMKVRAEAGFETDPRELSNEAREKLVKDMKGLVRRYNPPAAGEG